MNSALQSTRSATQWHQWDTPQSAAIEQLETSTTRAASETARAVESASQIPAFGGHDTLGGQVVEINRHLERISRSSR